MRQGDIQKVGLAILFALVLAGFFPYMVKFGVVRHLHVALFCAIAQGVLLRLFLRFSVTVSVFFSVLLFLYLFCLMPSHY